MGLLHAALALHLREGEEGEEPAVGAPLGLAIVGRPNVGKSTLVNGLLGEERLLTGPEPGLTREAVAVTWSWGERTIRLVDTAGLRRRARVTDRLEKMSTEESLGAIRYAEVVVLLLDATARLERQDLTIARHVADEGRALVIALNKWDLVTDPQATLRLVRERLEDSLPQLRGIRLVTLSALTGRGCDKLLPAVAETYEVWNRRVPTGPLNRWLETTLGRHPPPVVQGRRVRLRYITQIKSRPPTFALFTTRPEALPDSYLRYLTNALRESFDLPGVPLRLVTRKGRNPYVEEGARPHH
jgi:GTP-binding protein